MEAVLAVGAVVLLVSTATIAGLSPLDDERRAENAANVTLAQDDGVLVRHSDPAAVEAGAADLNNVSVRLARSLGVRLNTSAAAVRDEEFAAAAAELGPGYEADAERLAAIAAATDDPDAERLAAAFRTAGDRQRRSVAQAERFRELYTEYQQARAAGDEAEARALAGRLTEQASELNQTAEGLREAYDELEAVNETRADRAQRLINQSVERVQRIAANTRTSTYRTTRLTARAVEATGSPARPLAVVGRLRTTDGTPLTDRTVVAGPPSHRTVARTNATGGFRLEHSPTTLDRGSASLSLSFEPSGTTGNLGSTTSVPVTVDAAPVTVDVAAAPATVNAAAPGRITGSVRADGPDPGVVGVPVEVRVDGRRVATARTDATGQFESKLAVDRSIPAGRTELTVVAGRAGSAVEPTRVSRPARVTPVDTALSATAERVASGTVRVTGRLQTVAGAPLGGQSVTVSAGEAPFGLLTVDDDGRFAGNLSLTAEQVDGAGRPGSVSVVVRFTGASTHLAGSQVTETVAFPSVGGPFGLGVPAWQWVGALAAVAVLAGATAVALRLSGAGDADESLSPGPDDGPPATRSAESGEPEPESESDPTATLAAATAAVGESTRRAADLGYVAVRARLVSDLALEADGRALTHWEFYRACRDRELDDETLARFRRLTELYERAVYTDQSVDAATVRTTLAAFDPDDASSARISDR